ncbi:ArnT family glycosyltransferase [Ascidiimonas aurantiaca]|uniref:ArnT family glycosyltransferase n=1 Tax=Ascidiimonas aurantiaca TaxID=1685432 RepID=UPI0030EC44B3
MKKWLEQHPVKTIAGAGILIFLLHLQILPVTIMEARNFITAREMVIDGHWLLTTMNGLPRYEKPPLPTWFTAISGSIFGLHVYALRLPTALMAVFTAIITYFFSLKLVGSKLQSIINALILLTSFYIIAITNEAPWDIYTHGFMLTSIYFLFRLLREKPKKWQNALLAGFCFGASFMSKGPIGLYALFLPFSIAYGISYRFKTSEKKTLSIILYICTALVTASWWFIYVRVTDPGAFIEITRKETGNWASYNIRPFYYYWSFFTQSGIWAIPSLVALMYPYLRKKVTNPSAYRLTFLWTVFAVILLSVIPEKKTRYLAPVLIPMAMNTGFYITYLINHFQEIKKSWEKWVVYFNFSLIALIGLIFPLAGFFLLDDDRNSAVLPFVLTATALFVLAITIIRQLFKKNIFKVFIATVSFIIAITAFGLPLARLFQKNTAFHNIDTLADKMIMKETPVYGFGDIAPEMLWYYGSPLPIIQPENMVFPDEEQYGVLLTPAMENEFKRIFAPGYDMKQTEVFDLNYASGPGEKGHKKRLVSTLYILSKK